MTLKVDVSQLADIALAADIKGADRAIVRIEKAVNLLSKMVADHYQIKALPAEHMSVEFGGLLVAFGPGEQGQRCPDAIKAADPEGDW